MLLFFNISRHSPRAQFRPAMKPSSCCAPPTVLQVADIGLVADGEAALAELIQKLPPRPSSHLSRSATSAAPAAEPSSCGPTGDLSFTRASDLFGPAAAPQAEARRPAQQEEPTSSAGPTGDLSFTRASDLIDAAAPPPPPPTPSPAPDDAAPPSGGPTGDLSFTRASDLV